MLASLALENCLHTLRPGCCYTFQVKLEFSMLGSVTLTAGGLRYLEMYMHWRVLQYPFTSTFLNIYGIKKKTLPNMHISSQLNVR